MEAKPLVNIVKSPYFLLGILLVSLLACSDRGTAGGSFMNQLSLATIDGKTVSKTHLKDKILILNLWATWCGPCIKEMPDLEAMQKRLPEDFVLLLASDESSGLIQQFAEGHAFDLEFVAINNTMSSLGVHALPTTFIVGKDGQLLEKMVGAKSWNDDRMIQHLNEYLQ